MNITWFYADDSQVDFCLAVLSVGHDEGGYSGILTVFSPPAGEKRESVCVVGSGHGGGWNFHHARIKSPSLREP